MSRGIKVYTVTMYAIYDQGTGGVFTTLQAAVAHARSLAEDSDGHHDFRIDARILDRPVDIPSSHRWMTLYEWLPEADIPEAKAKLRRTNGEPEIIVNDNTEETL